MISRPDLRALVSTGCANPADLREIKMSEQTIDTIYRLQEVDAATLRRLWTEVRGTAPPKTFTARLMRLALAWDTQAAREGCETAKVRQHWNRIAKGRCHAGSSKQGVVGMRPSVGAGTYLLKEWGDVTHEVLVTDGGATWNGQSYRSLSAVARAMTGKNRNGPKFFGLREVGKA